MEGGRKRVRERPFVYCVCYVTVRTYFHPFLSFLLFYRAKVDMSCMLQKAYHSKQQG